MNHAARFLITLIVAGCSTQLSYSSAVIYTIPQPVLRVSWRSCSEREILGPTPPLLAGM